MGKDASSFDSTKVAIKSTTREPTTARRSHSAKPATKCSQTQSSCTTVAALNNQLLVRGGPPAVVAAASNSKPHKIASLDINKQAPESQCPPGSTVSTCRRVSPPAASPFPNGPMPTVFSASVSANQEDAITGNQNDRFTVTNALVVKKKPRTREWEIVQLFNL